MKRVHRALVTGGSKGIGAATIDALLERGVDVVGLSRKTPSRWLNTGKAPSDWIECDVLDPKQMEKVVFEIPGMNIDILVNCVGGGGTWGSDFFNTFPDTYSDVYAKNAGAMIQFTRMAAAGMCKRGWGRIVTVASIHGKEAGGKPLFAMAKAAEIAYSKTLSRDPALARRGVTVNVVAPGFIDVGKPGLPPVGDTVPGRHGKPEEVAAVVAFLCSEEASFVNGATIAIDGGEGRSY